MADADYAGLNFGARMKRAREANGVSLRQIADATKISVSALEALERNDISRLPGGIFSRAFVRSYASEIGIDPEQTVREFLSQFPHESVTAGSPHVQVEQDGAVDRRRVRVRIALAVVAVSVPVAAGVVYFSFVRGPAPEPTRPADRPALTDTAALGPSEGEPLLFEIITRAPLTLQVIVDGAARESRAVIAGERFVFQAQREMTLTASDAGAVQLSINSQPTVPLGKSGESRTVQIDRRNYGSFLASQ